MFVRYVCIRVLVCLPSTERGAVGDHMDTERPPVAWKLHCPRQGAANKTHAYRKKKMGTHTDIFKDSENEDARHIMHTVIR